MPLSSDALSISTEGHLFRWNTGQPLGTPVVITYSFMTTLTAYDVRTTASITPFSDMQKSGVRDAFDKWEEVSGLTFLEVEGTGDITLTMIDESGMSSVEGRPAAGFAYLPFAFEHQPGEQVIFHDSIGGDVFMNATAYGDETSYNVGERGFETMLHEIGHALGLEHPFDGDFIIDPARDNTDVTIMSYTDGSNPSELGTADIELIQFLYGSESYETEFNDDLQMLKIFGTNASEYLHGSSVSDFFSASRGADTVFGSDGDDFAILTGQDLFDGGNGRDTAIAVMGANTITDSGGLFDFSPTPNTNLEIDDFFMGGFGNDTLEGGLGNDLLLGDRPSQFLSGEDVINGGRGSDFLQGGGGADVFYFKANDHYTNGAAEAFRILGPDVIGHVSANDINTVLNGSSSTISELIARASRDFEIGIDKIELDDINFSLRNDLRNDLSNYLTDTADGVLFESYANQILFIDVTAAELLAVSFSDIFDFV